MLLVGNADLYCLPVIVVYTDRWGCPAVREGSNEEGEDILNGVEANKHRGIDRLGPGRVVTGARSLLSQE